MNNDCCNGVLQGCCKVAADCSKKRLIPLFMRVSGCCKYCCNGFAALLQHLAAKKLENLVFMRAAWCCKYCCKVLQQECCKVGYIYTPPCSYIHSAASELNKTEK